MAEPPIPPGGWRAPDGSVVPQAAPAPTARPSDGGRRGAIIAGLILVGLGGLFLLRELFPAFDASLAWPIASVILGVVLVILAFRPRHD